MEKEEKKKLKKTKKETKNTKKEVSKAKKGLIEQIIDEMRKVHFPTRKEMVKYSAATIAFVIFFAIYFYVIELVMAFLKSLI